MDRIDRIILGQNQFFGVNHISDERGNKTLAHFSNVDNVIKYLLDAHDLGINALTIGTHPITPIILDAIRNNDTLKSNLVIYPSMPSPAKVLRLTSELGIPKALMKLLSQTSFSSKAKLLLKGGIGGVLGKDVNSILEALIEVELSLFHGLNIKGVFLSNNVNDLALGLDLGDIWVCFGELFGLKTRSGSKKLIFQKN